MNTRIAIAIAVDGPASSGKGTVARGVARALGYAYVDTGSMYRSVALFAAERGVDWSEAEAVAEVAASLCFDFAWDGDTLRVRVDGRDVTLEIRTGEMGIGASDVSAHPPVRAALLGLQRSMGAEGGVVMDGRDIGTVVLPEAELKVYLDASLAERARRRWAELVARGEEVERSVVERDLAERDRQDRERAVAPLKVAEDAVVVDTTSMSIDEAIEAVLSLARERQNA